MSDLNFPSGPLTNDIYSSGGKTWIWDGNRWKNHSLIYSLGGGTGFASYNKGDLLVAGGTALSILPIGVSNSMYLKVDSTSAFGVTWSTPISNGLQYDIAYFKQAGNALTGTKGFFTYYDGSGLESVTIKSNYSFAFSVKNTSDNNKFYVDVSNGRTIFTGSSADHEIRVYNANESTYFGLKANSTGSRTYIMPPGGPSTGTSVLQSDTSGNMLWVPMVAGGLSNAVTSINSQTGPSVSLQTGNSGSDFAISATTNTITFDLPSASASARGLVTTGSQTIAGAKTFSSSIVGNLSGYASTSTSSQVVVGTEDSTHYVVFSPNGNTTIGTGLSSSNSATKLGYNPSTNVLTVGSVNGNLSGTATTSRNSNLAEAIHSADHYVVFSLIPTSTSGIGLSTSNSTSKLSYNPNSNVLIVGSVTGNVTGNLTGTATTAANTSLAAATDNTAHYVVFSRYGINNSPSGIGLSTSNSNTKLAYNPSSNVLTVGSVSGNVTGDLTGTVLTASQTNITALGTITTGTWNATAISTTKGGTGLDLSSSSGLIKFNSGTATVVNYPTATSIGSSFLSADTSGNVFWVGMTSGASVAGGTATSIFVNQTGNPDTFHSLVMNSSVLAGTALSVDSLLSYNTSTETLYTSGLAITLVGTAVSYGYAPSLFAGGIGVSDNITALNKIGVGVSANNVTRSEMYASGTDIGFRIYESTNSNPRVLLSRNILGSSQPALAFMNGSGTIAASGAVVGVPDAATTATLALITSNASALQTRMLVLGGNTNITTNTIVFGLNTSGTAITSFLRGIDATGSNIDAGEFVIQSGRSTGTGAVGGIRFSVASPGSTGSGINLGASIARISGTGISINVQTASTSLITGSFVTLGGAGIGLSLNLGRGLNFWNSTASNYIQLGFAGTSNTSYTLPSNTPLTGVGISVLASTHEGEMRWVGLPVPGGSNLDVQYNNSGVLAGLTGFTKGSAASDPLVIATSQAATSTPLKLVGASSQSANLLTVSSNIADQVTIDSAGNLSLRDKNELRLYNDADTNYSGFYFDGTSNSLYKLPAAYPGVATSTLICDTSGNMTWIRPKRSYVLSFGAGFTPTANAADSIQLNIPYAPDGTALDYIIKRIEYRNETTSGGTGLSFYIQRHIAGDVAWSSANTITAGSGTSFLVGSGTYQTSFTTINSSSGTHGLVSSGNYIRLYFTIVGTAANVSLSLLMEEQ